MLKILQARLQQYMNCELPDVRAGFRKGKGTKSQIANIHWIIKNAKEFQQNISFCFIDYANAFVWIPTNCGKFFKRWEEYTEELSKKNLQDLDNHDGVITHLEPNILYVKSSGP